MDDFEKEWLQFMIDNKKWDSKNNTYRFLKPDEYHEKTKTVSVMIMRGDGTEYPSLQCVHDGWELGPELFDYCQLCGKDLNEMRNNEQKVIKFCCKDHSIEYSKRKRIRKEKFGDENTMFSWPTEKESIVRTDIQVGISKNDKFSSFPLKARKSKWAKKES